MNMIFRFQFISLIKSKTKPNISDSWDILFPFLIGCLFKLKTAANHDTN